MKPIDLKEIAQRFTSKYYSQWISRVDRIWNMFENIDLNRILSESSTSEHQLSNAFGIAGTTEPQFNECISGIAILAFTYQNVKGEDNITEKDIKKQISIVPVDQKIAADLQQKIETVLGEMLPSIVENATKSERTVEPSNPKKALENNLKSDIDKTNEFVIYLPRPSGLGTEKDIVSEEDIHTQHLSNKRQFDIIVFQESVQKKPEGKRNIISLELDRNILNLLVLFVKYKDIRLPYFELYNKAWEGSVHYNKQAIVPGTNADVLKTAVSNLRNTFKDIEGFNIPHARGGGYICKGIFKYCLILSKSKDQWYSLEGV